MNKTKTFITTIGGIVPILTCAAIGIIFIIGLIGCPEAEQMVKPVVSEEPADTEQPTTVGEVKQLEEPVEPTEQPTEPEVVEKPTEPEDPTPPADTTPPTVIEVAWYSDLQLTEAIVDDVQPGDTIYKK